MSQVTTLVDGRLGLGEEHRRPDDPIPGDGRILENGPVDLTRRPARGRLLAVLEPSTWGSTAWLTKISTPTNMASVTKKTPFPGNAANAKARGTAAPSHGPM